MRILFILTLLVWANPSLSHQFSTANLTLEQTSPDSHVGYISVSIEDLQQTLSLDPNKDGNLTWGELTRQHHSIINYFKKTVTFNSNEGLCNTQWGQEISLTESYGELLLKQPLETNCTSLTSISYTAFFDTTSDHKLLLNWSLTKGQTQAIFDSPQQHWKLDTDKTSSWQTFIFYLYQGMVHIWIGLDHVLFVITLLLHFLWRPSSNDTISSQTSNPHLKLKPMIWLITGFTIAHSITLTLTALDWISISSKWAEVGIAVSVAYSALNVITHWIKRLMVMTVAFGLLHGMGFAGALSELGLSKSHQLTSILGFNIGVEIGQLVIILVALPILWLLSKHSALKKIVVPIIALGIFTLGMLWVWQRI